MHLDELLAREAIRDTMARYTVAGDRLRVEDFVAVFTEDGVLASDGVDDSDAFRHEGRAAIRRWIAAWGNRGIVKPAPTFVRHHLSTSVVELTSPQAARARTYWVAYTDIGPDHSGQYLDVFCKTADRWLLAERKVRLDWRAGNSLFSTAIRDIGQTA